MPPRAAPRCVWRQRCREGFVHTLPLRKPRECGFWVRCWLRVCFFRKPPTCFQSGCATSMCPPAVSSCRCDKAPQTGGETVGPHFLRRRGWWSESAVGAGRCRGRPPCHSSSAPCSAPCGLLPPEPPPRALRSHTALGASASTREVGATRFPRDRASVRIAFLCHGRDRCVVTPRGSNLRLSKAGRTPAPSAPREPAVSSCLLPIF